MSGFSAQGITRLKSKCQPGPVLAWTLWGKNVFQTHSWNLVPHSYRTIFLAGHPLGILWHMASSILKPTAVHGILICFQGLSSFPATGQKELFLLKCSCQTMLDQVHWPNHRKEIHPISRPGQWYREWEILGTLFQHCLLGFWNIIMLCLMCLRSPPAIPSFRWMLPVLELKTSVLGNLPELFLG